MTSEYSPVSATPTTHAAPPAVRRVRRRAWMVAASVAALLSASVLVDTLADAGISEADRAVELTQVPAPPAGTTTSVSAAPEAAPPTTSAPTTTAAPSTTTTAA